MGAGKEQKRYFNFWGKLGKTFIHSNKKSFLEYRQNC